MTKTERVPEPPIAAIATCMFLSGAGSLVLEVVWTRYLRLVFGSTTLATSTILVAYMTGLGLGAIAAARWSERIRNGVRAYGLVELGIGVYALLVPLMLGVLPWINAHVLASLTFWPAVLLRFVVVLLVLLVPTLLMGASLPVLVAAVGRRRTEVGRRVGLLYGINTLGAVAGVVISTFVLFPLVGLTFANVAGAGLDIVAGAVALALLSGRVRATVATPRATASLRAGSWSNPAVLSYGLIGFTALTYEVGWTRALSMICGSSIYAFSTMLAAFLLGIGLGSVLIRGRIDRLRRPAVTYALGAFALAATSIAILPAFGLMPSLLLTLCSRFGLTGQTVVAGGMLIALMVMFVPALILGAMFPLVVRIARGTEGAPGEAVGLVYFVNTVGSAAGAFAAGFVLIPWLGLKGTLVLAAVLNVLVACIAVLREPAWPVRRRRALVGVGVVTAAAVAILAPGFDTSALTKGVYYRAPKFMDFGLPLEEMDGIAPEQLLFYRDGTCATASIHRENGGINLRINGKPDASFPDDMPTQVLSAEVPLLFGGPAHKVLVIGYASGVTTGSALLHEPERIDVVEIEPVVMEASRYFDAVNGNPRSSPRVRVILDDGRTYLASTTERYDVIISEPSNPFLVGSASLFTREYFRLARQALAAGGRLCQWVQLYGLKPDSVRVLIGTVTSEFPYVYAFMYGSDYPDLLLLASERPLTVEDLPRWTNLRAPVQQDLERVRIRSEAELWSLLRLLPDETRAIGKDAPALNTDATMYVELRAPWTVHTPVSANRPLFESYSRGILPLLAGSKDATVDRLADIALHYEVSRGEPRIGRAALDIARKGGETAETLVADAVIGWLEEPARTQHASDLLNRAVATDPHSFQARYWRARLNYQFGDAAAALADVDAALSVRPADAEALYLKVRTLGMLNRFPEAAAAADSLLASPLATLEAKYWSDAAVAAGGSGQFDKAIDRMRRFLERWPQSPTEWSILAEMYRGAGRQDDAARASVNADRAGRNVLRLEHRAARYQLALGSRDAGLAILRSIVQKEPSYEPARADLIRYQTGSR